MFTRRLNGFLLLAGLVAGCSSSGGSTGQGQGPQPSGGGDGNFGTLTPAANDTNVTSPFDATPDLDGTHVYFTAVGPKGPGVFTVAASGGPITEVYSGAPFVSPFSIALSDDGGTLFVSDNGVETSDTVDGGVIFSLPAAGGTPSQVAGTAGVYPHGLEVSNGQLYFTGSAPDGTPGVFQMPLAGGSPSTVFSGAPFVSPSGVAIAQNGDVYVVDTESGSSGFANIVKVSGGQATVLVDGIQVGYPAGVVLVQNESALLLSAYAYGKGTDAVLRVELADNTQKYITTGIDTFFEPAGLHRAKQADIYAWADSIANNTGTVYVLSK
jgi:NHL repeat